MSSAAEDRDDAAWLVAAAALALTEAAMQDHWHRYSRGLPARH